MQCKHYVYSPDGGSVGGPSSTTSFSGPEAVNMVFDSPH